VLIEPEHFVQGHLALGQGVMVGHGGEATGALFDEALSHGEDLGLAFDGRGGNLGAIEAGATPGWAIELATGQRVGKAGRSSCGQGRFSLVQGLNGNGPTRRSRWARDG